MDTRAEATVEASFDAIYREHREFVRRSLRRLYVDDTDLEDVSQEVFVVLYRHLVEGELPQSMRAWLYQVARRVASNHRRGRTRHERKSGLPWRDSIEVDQEEWVVRKEAAGFVREFLEELDEDACRAFVLAEIEGLRGREVAERLGVEVTDAYARVRAVRRRFYRAVDRRRGTEGDRQLALLPGLLIGRGHTAAFAWTLRLVGLCVLTLGLSFVVRSRACVPEPNPVAQPERSDEPRGPSELDLSGEGPRRSVALEGAALPTSTERPLTASYVGRVEDVDGRPIAGATVCADRIEAPGHWLDSPPRCDRTDVGGAFRIDGVGDEAHQVSVMARGFVPGRAHALPRDPIVLRLRAGGLALRGRVLDVFGGPVPGAWVALRDRSEPALGSLVTADDHGEFEIWTRAGDVMLAAGADGYATQFSPALVPGAPLEIELSPASSISGVVVDATTGVGVADVRVSALLIPEDDVGRSVRQPQLSTRTDDAGRFTIDGLQARRYIVDASKPGAWGRAPGPVDLGIAEIGEGVTIELVPGHMIAGRISDAETGGPCLDGHASVTDSVLRIAQEGRVDAEGRVRIDSLTGGEYEVTVACRGYRTASFLVSSATEPELQDWPLERGAVVRGRVLSADGTPVPEAEVKLMLSRGWAGAWDKRPNFVVTGADGVFEFRGVAPGTHDLRAAVVEHPYAPGKLIAIGPDTELVDSDIVLEEGGSVSGRVTNAGGAGVPGALVVVEIEPVPPHPFFGHGPEDRDKIRRGGPFVGRTDETGEFRIPGVRAGSYGVWIRAGDVAVRSGQAIGGGDPPATHVDVAAGADTRMDIEVAAPTAMVRGRVVGDDGDVFADTVVVARSVARPSGGSVGAVHVERVLTELDGSFALAGLFEGRYRLTAYRRGGSVAELEVDAPADGVELEFASPARISGTVFDADGSSPQGFALTWLDRDSNRVDWVPIAGTDGRFELSLAPGVYTLVIDVEGQRGTRDVELGPGDALDGLRVDLRRQTLVRGRLVDTHGVPLDGHIVALMDGEKPRVPDALIRYVVTEPSGEFVLECLPAEAAREVYLLAGTETTPAAFSAAVELRRLQLSPEQSVSVGDVTLIEPGG